MAYYLRKFKGINTAVALLYICICGMQTLGNLLLIQIFQAIVNLDMGEFLRWIAADLLLFAGLLLLDGLRNALQAQAVRKMNNQVRRDITESLLRRDYGAYHDQDSGEYLSWLTNDVNQIEQLAWKPFFNFIMYTFDVLFSIIALVSLHWSLAVASLAAAVIMMAVPRLFQKQMERLGSVCSEQQAAAVSRLKDLLSGFDVLRFFGKSQQFTEESEKASDQIESPKCQLSVRKTWISNGVSLVSVLCQLAVDFLIGLLSIQGVIIQSALMGGGNLASTVSNGLSRLADLRLSFAASKPYFDKITTHAEGKTAASLPDIPQMQDSITVEHLSFSYGSHCVLRNLSMEFQKGGKYAVTGPSGCGKSTLLKLLLGWLPDEQGAVRMDGRAIREYAPEQLQRQMSYIEQDVFLFNTSIRDNIMLGEEFSNAQLHGALQNSALEGDLAQLPDGLDTIVGESGANLSGGQKQRVAIARALIHARSILLVDEGTSALDQTNADLVERSLLANRELTLILVSHHLSQERKNQFDRVFELATAEQG
ncbi:MAG: ABC transporter ATP-binding protein/permease [Clostridiales bacterium]|nr:ABC transporter ATP-binding protein/permease [Clostridiales bacterium]